MYAVSPWDDILFLVSFGMYFNTLRTERFEAIEFNAEIWDLLARVLVALNSWTVGSVHYNCINVVTIIAKFKMSKWNKQTPQINEEFIQNE